MPTLTFNNYPPVDGNTLDASRVEGWLRDETDTDATLSIINGVLDTDNTVDALGVKAEHTQRGSWVDARSVSGTTNLDYFNNYFNGYDSTTWNSSNVGQSRAIPGASIRKWIPWTSDVLVLANVMWGNTSEANNDKSWMYLAVDGVFVNDQRRDVRHSLQTLTDGTTATDLHRGYRRSRTWSCMYLAESVSEGFHDFSLNLISDQLITMTRVWARHMIVVPLKR